MEAVQMDRWYFMVLIFLPFLKVAVQQKEYTGMVHLEEGMILDCFCPWNGNFSMVSWTKLPDKTPIAVFHPEYGVAFAHPYRERVEFLRNTVMDGSISMRNVTHQDMGLYQCSIQTFPQGSWTRNVQVEDLDDPPVEDEITLTPTPEILVDTELVVVQSDNLTIRCNHEHNGTVYQVILEKMAPGEPWGIIGVCKVVEGVLVGKDYSERGLVSCAQSLDVSLELTAVAQEDGGFYRCSFSTDAGVQTTTVLLTVPTPGEFSLEVYMMYIYIGAGVAGLILLIVVVVLTVRHRKKNWRTEYRVKLRPSERRPNFYENISVYGKKGRRPERVSDGPVYANYHQARSHKAQASVGFMMKAHK
ncbi:CD226 antigen [Genypterus blacodes]|uniref:CD226 antigen n=1 Tax=Genypterus blacodes TaxID=154954 RepID=UPI003F764CA3